MPPPIILKICGNICMLPQSAERNKSNDLLHGSIRSTSKWTYFFVDGIHILFSWIGNEYPLTTDYIMI